MLHRKRFEIEQVHSLKEAYSNKTKGAEKIDIKNSHKSSLGDVAIKTVASGVFVGLGINSMLVALKKGEKMGLTSESVSPETPTEALIKAMKESSEDCF